VSAIVLSAVPWVMTGVIAAPEKKPPGTGGYLDVHPDDFPGQAAGVGVSG